MRPHPEQNIQHQIIILILVRIKDFLCNFCTAAPGVHGALFNVAVGGGFGHAETLHKKKLGPIDKANLLHLLFNRELPLLHLPQPLAV